MGISEISFGGQKGERSIIKTNKCKVSIQHCFYYFVSDNHASIYTVLIYIQKITNLPKYLSQCDLKTESEFTQKIKIHSTFFVSFRPAKPFAISIFYCFMYTSKNVRFVDRYWYDKVGLQHCSINVENMKENFSSKYNFILPLVSIIQDKIKEGLEWMYKIK